MSKRTVGVFFGSRSTEHDVSIVTAISSIIKPLELSGKYEVEAVYIDKRGRFYSDPQLKDISLFSSGRIDDFLAKSKPVLMRIGNGLELVKPGLKSKSLKIDIAFPATHGTHGEDGELMGLFEMANIPYVGCDVASSAIAMDKALSKTIVRANGINTSKFVWFYADEYISGNKTAIDGQIAGLSYPLFVKPVHLGSSIAITKVANPKELIQAIELAAHYDNKIIVEEAVNNLTEVTLPIMGNEEPRPALLEEPLTKDDKFFDFDAKYLRGGKKGKGAKTAAGTQLNGYSKLPAPLDEKLYSEAQATALSVYRTIGCSGIARVDLLIDNKTRKVYFNEINPLPGSLYAHNWRAAGVSGVELVNKLIELADQRFAKAKDLQTVFATSYLKQY